MPSFDRPRFRPILPYRVEHEGRAFVAFSDSLGVADASLLVPLELFQLVLRHCDGVRTLPEIQAQVRVESGRSIPLDQLEDLIARLERAMILRGPTFEAFRAAYRAESTRPAALAGRAYHKSEPTLRAQLARFFESEHGPGLPRPRAATGRLRGILSPHIDFTRGGTAYGWSYRELVERSNADIFVILGVAHQACENRFALTHKDFETPLGAARTNRAYVDRLAALGGPHLFDDELAHRTEHSIEFQVVFLQYLLGARRDFEIVPILVGSFHDLMESGVDPIADPEIRRFVAALQDAERACGRRVAYIGGIDLGHIGREFGDPDLLDAAMLDQLRHFDSGMLEHAIRGDATSWFGHAAQAGDRFRTCGLAATYTLLHAIGPAAGTLLRYEQAVNPERTCCVSFASVAFQESDPPRV